ncbi:LpxL/LpxP family acyltransferase [Coraliomargarita sp. W4R72]
MGKEALPFGVIFAFNVALLILLKVFCRLLVALPACVAQLLCRFFALLVIVLMPNRRRSTLRSLHHAFPDQSEVWRQQVFRESAARLFEMGLFRPAASFFSEKRLDESLEIPAEAAAIIQQYLPGQPKHGHPLILLMPHMTMGEAGSFLPRYFPDFPPTHVIFRPLNQPSINEWVMAERERYGAKMLSRKSGYNDAMAALRRGEAVGLLFDQDASKKGTTITFMDRIVSATDLPGLMAHRFEADVLLMLTERKSFWKAKLSLQQIPLGDSPTELSVRTHDALEAYLRRDANSAADWLWLHDRWDHFYSCKKRFRMPAKRNQLELSNRVHGYEATPRKTRLWVRLPNWLGDVVMALPILRAIRAGRPDFELTLIGKAAFQPLVDRLGVADHFIPLPARDRGYFKAFYAMRKSYPDTYLLLTNSFRGDFEAFLTRCQQRFGMVRPGKRRPLLTDSYHLPAKVDETQMHQTAVWEMMARHCGLEEALDFAPVAVEQVERVANRVGLICGTENSPEKRWPIAHWRALIDQLIAARPKVEIVLYGTPADRSITEAVCEGFAPDQVRNLAGQTNLSEFCDELSSCAVVSCNDTGGMHLANMLGTPVVAVFGPTNPVRTGPIFSTPHTILQPADCPATGGMDIDQVSAERCVAAVLSHLPESA